MRSTGLYVRKCIHWIKYSSQRKIIPISMLMGLIFLLYINMSYTIYYRDPQHGWFNWTSENSTTDTHLQNVQTNLNNTNAGGELVNKKVTDVQTEERNVQTVNTEVENMQSEVENVDVDVQNVQEEVQNEQAELQSAPSQVEKLKMHSHKQRVEQKEDATAVAEDNMSSIKYPKVRYVKKNVKENFREMTKRRDNGFMYEKNAIYQQSLADISCEDPGYSMKGYDQYPIKFMEMKPHEFLKNYRNPCWYEEFPSEYLYSHYLMCRYGRRYFKDAVALWEQLRASGTRWRLRCLPYFYIGGVTKSGTTEIYEKISMHPMINTGLLKEPQWWNRERIRIPVPPGDPLKDYVDMFDYAAAKIESYVTTDKDGEPYHPMVAGEASAGTIWLYDMWKQLPENEGYDEPKYLTAHYIKHFQPDAKTIVTLRNPTDRLYADYFYFHNPNNTDGEEFHSKVAQSIEMAKLCLSQYPMRQCLYNTTFFTPGHIPIKAIRRGIYYAYINDWLKVFPRKQLYVLRLEDYSTNKVKYLNEMYKFLGLDSLPQDLVNSLESTAPANQNRHKQYRPSLLPKTKYILDKFYAPYNKQLSQLLQDERFLWRDN